MPCLRAAASFDVQEQEYKHPEVSLLQAPLVKDYKIVVNIGVAKDSPTAPKESLAVSTSLPWLCLLLVLRNRYIDVYLPPET